MANTRDIDAAKDRLVDSLSSARDVAVTAVRDDIAPAVAAAVEAAREASGPVYAEAASRAGDAMSALRGSDAAHAVRNSDAVKILQGKTRAKRRRWPIVAAFVAVGATAATIVKQRARSADLIDLTESPTDAMPRDEAADSPITDATSS